MAISVSKQLNTNYFVFILQVYHIHQTPKQFSEMWPHPTEFTSADISDY